MSWSYRRATSCHHTAQTASTGTSIHHEHQLVGAGELSVGLLQIPTCLLSSQPASSSGNTVARLGRAAVPPCKKAAGAPTCYFDNHHKMALGLTTFFEMTQRPGSNFQSSMIKLEYNWSLCRPNQFVSTVVIKRFHALGTLGAAPFHCNQGAGIFRFIFGFDFPICGVLSMDPTLTQGLSPSRTPFKNMWRPCSTCQVVLDPMHVEAQLLPSEVSEISQTCTDEFATLLPS